MARTGEPWFGHDSIFAYVHVMILKEALEQAGVADRRKVSARDPRARHDRRPGAVLPRRAPEIRRERPPRRRQAVRRAVARRQAGAGVSRASIATARRGLAEGLTAMAAVAALLARLRLPLIAAPMFRVSGVDLVVAACRSGVIGAFPTANCRSVEELDAWLPAIRAGASGGAVVRQPDRAPVQSADEGRPRGAAAACAGDRHHQCRLAGGGRRRRCMMRARWCSPTSPRSAMPNARSRRGRTGLILLTAGAGGQTGWLNPFAFVRAVRSVLRRAAGAGRRHRRRPGTGRSAKRWAATWAIWALASSRRPKAWRSRNINRCWWKVTPMTSC